MSQQPSISVIIPAYNHERYIGDAIQSVLEQSYGDYELIIINDGSTDDTESEIKKFNDQRINYISRENRGAHATINQGIDISKGEYLSILNSDDIYKSDRLEKCLSFLQENKTYSAVITEVEGIDDEGESVLLNRTPHIDAWLTWYQEALLFIENSEMFIGSLGVNILITTSNYFLRKEVFHNTGKFRELRYTHDWEFLLRLTQKYSTYLMRDSLLKYRIHQSNTVHEDDSDARVKFEVNWLIAECLRSMSTDVDNFKVIEAMKKNHYLNYEVLTLLSLLNRRCPSEQYLNFDNDVTSRIVRLLK